MVAPIVITGAAVDPARALALGVVEQDEVGSVVPPPPQRRFTGTPRADTMAPHPLALQSRNPHSLVEIGVDENTTSVFAAPLMTTIAEVGAFLARETAATLPFTVERMPLNGDSTETAHVR